MLLRQLPTGASHLPTGMRVGSVRDAAELRRFNHVFSLAFDLPLDPVEMLFSPALLEEPTADLLLGSIDTIPAAVSLVLHSHGVALIFAVGTVPDFRRRGLGTAMTWQAIQLHRQECAAAYLTSSAIGFSVYRKMGFQHVTNYRRWAMTHPPG